MKAVAAVLVFSAFTSAPAFALAYVKCGQTANLEDGEVTGYEIELSSESDNFTGPAGGTWNLKLKEDAEWLANVDQNDVAQTKETKSRTQINIRISPESALAQGSGVVYKLSDLYDEEPTLEKFKITNANKLLSLGQFQCFTAND